MSGAPVFVYAVACRGFIKIGLATNTHSRLKGMQSGNPYPIEMLITIPLPVDSAVQAERDIMRELDDKHWDGDWFRCSKSHAKYVVNAVCNRLLKAPAPAPDYSRPKSPGHRRKVIAPDGRVFESASKAGEFLGVSRQAMFYRLDRKWNGWRWA